MFTYFYVDMSGDLKLVVMVWLVERLGHDIPFVIFDLFQRMMEFSLILSSTSYSPRSSYTSLKLMQVLHTAYTGQTVNLRLKCE